MNGTSDRELVVFVHSTGTGPSLWAGVPDSAVGNRRKLCPANVGYSADDLLPRGVACVPSDDAARVLLAIPAESSVHLVAHSYGALVALHAAKQLGARVASLFFFEPVVFGRLLDDPDVDSLAREQARTFHSHPWFLTDDERGGRDAWLEVFVDYWNRPGSWSRMPEGQKEQTRALGWKMYQEVRSCFFDDIRPDRLGITAPTTVVYGDKTTVAAVAMAKLVARSIPAARLLHVPGLSHMAPLSQPDRVHPILADHFAKL